MFFDEFLSHVLGGPFRLDDAFVVAFEDDDGVYHSGIEPCTTTSKIVITPFEDFVEGFCEACRSKAEGLPFTLAGLGLTAEVCFFDDAVRLKDEALSSLAAIPSMRFSKVGDLFDFCARFPYQDLDAVYVGDDDTLLTFSDGGSGHVFAQQPSSPYGFFNILGWAPVFEDLQLDALHRLVASSSVDMVALKAFLARQHLDGSFGASPRSEYTGFSRLGSISGVVSGIFEDSRSRTLEAYSSDESSYLVALEPTFNIFRALWAFFPSVSRSPGDCSILVVPSVVADLVGNQLGFEAVAAFDAAFDAAFEDSLDVTPGSALDSTLGSIPGDALGGVPAAVLETALTLYDPCSEEFSSLRKALDAALRIESHA